MAQAANGRGNGKGNGKKPGNGKRPHGNSKLIPELIDALCEAVRKGIPIIHAAEMCGIGHATVYRWRELGAENPNSEYGLFLDRLNRARIECVKHMFDIIQKAAVTDARHAEWVLEHCYSEYYGKTRVEISGEVTQTVRDDRILDALRADPSAITLIQQLSELVATHSGVAGTEPSA